MRRSKWEIIGDMNTMKWWQVLLLILPLLIIFPILYFLDLACICVFGICGLYLLIVMTVFTVLKIIAAKRLKKERHGYGGFDEEFRETVTGDRFSPHTLKFDEGEGTGPGGGEFSGYLGGKDTMYKKGIFRKPRYFRECQCHPETEGLPSTSHSPPQTGKDKKSKKKKGKEKTVELQPPSSTTETTPDSTAEATTDTSKKAKPAKKEKKKKEKKKKKVKKKKSKK